MTAIRGGITPRKPPHREGPAGNGATFTPNEIRPTKYIPGGWPQEAHADLGLVDDDHTPDLRHGWLADV